MCPEDIQVQEKPVKSWADLESFTGVGGVKKWVQPTISLTLCWPLSCYFSARAEAPCPPAGDSRLFWGASIPHSPCWEEKECGPACSLGSRRRFGAGRGRGRLRRGLLLALCSLLLYYKVLPPTFQAVQPCSGHPDPTEAHGAPQTGSPAPASPPAAHWPLRLCWDWLPLSAPLEHPLSARCSHGKVPLPGGGTCLPQAAKFPTLLSFLSYLPRPCALVAALGCPLHSLKGLAKVLVG